jgi:hypothetical protein
MEVDRCGVPKGRRVKWGARASAGFNASGSVDFLPVLDQRKPKRRECGVPRLLIRVYGRLK